MKILLKAELVPAGWFGEKVATWPNDVLVSEYNDAKQVQGNYKYCRGLKLEQLQNILGREIYNRGLYDALIS